MRKLLLPAVLVCVIAGCSDGGDPLAPGVQQRAAGSDECDPETYYDPSGETECTLVEYGRFGITPVGG